MSKLTIKCTKVNESKGLSYIRSRHLLKSKTTTIASKKNDDRCSQYAFTLMQHHEEIENYPKQI